MPPQFCEKYDVSDKQADDECCDNSASFSEIAPRCDGKDPFCVFSSKLSEPVVDHDGNSNHDRENAILTSVKSSQSTSESKDAESERQGDADSKRKRRSTIVSANSFSLIAESSVNSAKADLSLLTLSPFTRNGESIIGEMKAKSLSRRNSTVYIVGSNSKTSTDGMKNGETTNNGALSSFLRNNFGREDQAAIKEKPLSRPRLQSSSSWHHATANNLDNEDQAAMKEKPLSRPRLQSSSSWHHATANNLDNEDQAAMKEKPLSRARLQSSSSWHHATANNVDNEDQAARKEKPFPRPRLQPSSSWHHATANNLDKGGRNQRGNQYGLSGRSRSDEQLTLPEGSYGLLTKKILTGTNTETDEKAYVEKLLRRVSSMFHDNRQNALHPTRRQEIRMMQDKEMKEDKDTKKKEHDEKKKMKSLSGDKNKVKEPHAGGLLELSNDFSNKEEKQESTRNTTLRHDGKDSMIRKESQSSDRCLPAVPVLTRSSRNKLFSQQHDQEEEYPFIARIHRDSYQVNGSAVKTLHDSFLQLEFFSS